MKVKSESEVAESTPWTEAYQAPLSMGFSRQEYSSGLPLPSLHINLGTAFITASFLKNIFSYLAAPGLSCGTWDLRFSLQHTGSLAVACQLLAAACEF